MSRKFKTIKVRLPRDLLAALNDKIRREFYVSANEYVRDLIRKDLHAQSVAEVGEEPLENSVSGNGRPPEGGFWRNLHMGNSGDKEHKSSFVAQDRLAHLIDQVDRMLMDGLKSPLEPYDEKRLKKFRNDLKKHIPPAQAG
jgi:Arc/MetJ-type ribon-helix-helix transcriptional regulator